MQHMHLHLPLGLPYANWLLSQPWCPPKYKPIRRMVLNSLPGALWGATGDGQVKDGWSTGSQHGKQQRWSDLTFNPNYVNMAKKYETSTMSTSWIRFESTHQNMDNLAWHGLEDPNKAAYSPMEIYGRQTYQGRSSFRHATYALTHKTISRA
jgi:hypothetical protein